LREQKSGQSALDSSATSNIPSAGDFTPETCAVSPLSPPRRRSGDPTGQLFNRPPSGEGMAFARIGKLLDRADFIAAAGAASTADAACLMSRSRK